MRFATMRRVLTAFMVGLTIAAAGTTTTGSTITEIAILYPTDSTLYGQGWGRLDPIAGGACYLGYLSPTWPVTTIFSYVIPATVGGMTLDTLDAVRIEGFDVGTGCIDEWPPMRPSVFMTSDQAMNESVYIPKITVGNGYIELHDFEYWTAATQPDRSAIDTQLSIPVFPGTGYRPGTMDFIKDGQVIDSWSVMVANGTMLASVPEPATAMLAAIAILMCLGYVVAVRIGRSQMRPA